MCGFLWNVFVIKQRLSWLDVEFSGSLSKSNENVNTGYSNLKDWLSNILFSHKQASCYTGLISLGYLFILRWSHFVFLRLLCKIIFLFSQKLFAKRWFANATYSSLWIFIGRNCYICYYYKTMEGLRYN